MATRYLKQSKPKPQTYNYMTADIETGEDDKYKSALLGEPVYISWCKEGIGHGIKSDNLTDWLLDVFLTHEHNGWILYIHNGFGFDLKRVDWRVVAEIGFEASFLTGNDGSIKSVTITTDYGGETLTWIIRDTLLLIPMTLAKLTETFSPDCLKIKREVGFDVKAFDPDDPLDQEYAIQDSVALYVAVGIVDNLLLTLFDVSIHAGATLPGIAFRAFRQMIPEEQKFPGISFNLLHAARESYHGGQTIAFRTGTLYDAISLDANSMYPFVMLNWNLPTGETYHSMGLPGHPNPDRTLCLAVVKIPEGVFPLLKTKDKNGTVGNFNGVVTGWYWLFELEKQKELGAEFEVLESYVWLDDTDVCKKFSKKCHDLRMSDYHGARGAIAKLLNNSLYGKFAQNVAKYLMKLTMDQPDNGLPAYDPIKSDFVDALWLVPSKPSFNADMTHWASFITAKARVMLTDAIQKVGFDRIIYCDTDSIFFHRSNLFVSCPHCGGLGSDYIRFRNRATNYQFATTRNCKTCNGTGNEIRGIMGSEYGQFKIEKGSEAKGISFRAIAPKAYVFVEEVKDKETGERLPTLSVKNKGIPTKAILKNIEPNGKVEYIQSNNLSQMLKRGTGYGKKSKRKLATEESTTNGKIENQVWKPHSSEMRELDDIRISVENRDKQKSPSYLSIKYAMMIEEFRKGMRE